MPTIIAPTDFTAELTIAQTENQYMIGNVQEFIDKYEPKFLRALLGLTLANEFAAGREADPVEAKWTNLANNADLIDMLKSYIYYWYKRDESTKSMGISEAKPKAENATTTNSINKQVRAWNEMVELARSFDLDLTIYPNWHRQYWERSYNWHSRCGVNEIFYHINSLNF